MKTLPILAAVAAGLCFSACDTLIVDRGPTVERRGYRGDRYDGDRYDDDRRRPVDRVYVEPRRRQTVYVAPERRVYRESTYVAPQRRVYGPTRRSVDVDVNVNRY